MWARHLPHSKGRNLGTRGERIPGHDAQIDKQKAIMALTITVTTESVEATPQPIIGLLHDSLQHYRSKLGIGAQRIPKCDHRDSNVYACVLFIK